MQKFSTYRVSLIIVVTTPAPPVTASRPDPREQQREFGVVRGENGREALARFGRRQHASTALRLLRLDAVWRRDVHADEKVRGPALET